MEPVGPEPEVIVVGGGAVGLALAIRLARDGVRVTVLEAGPATPPADYRQHNRGQVSGRPHQGIGEGRMRALGGTTRLWGGQLVPFGPDDLDGPTVDGPSPWPVRHAELAPYLAAALAFLGMPAEVPSLALPPAFGDGLRLGISRWLPQPDFTQLFATDLAALPSLTVLPDHPVEGLAIDGRRAGLVVCGPDGVARRRDARHVVLAAGTFENARLLLRTAAMQPDCGFAETRTLAAAISTICTGWRAGCGYATAGSW